jgi:predicted  nucleic acid-binding Zn-ribbon protein
MSEHEQTMKILNDKMVDLQNSFITTIGKQVIKNMSDINDLNDRILKLESENQELKSEIQKEFGGTTND